MMPPTYRSALPTVMRFYRLRVPSHTRISTIRGRPRSDFQLLTTPVRRQFSQSTYLAYPRVGSQDKDSIDTEATEYSKSASDDEGARHEDPAFNPEITDPQQSKDVAGQGTGGDSPKNNPLDVSPANTDVSNQKDPNEGGPESSSSDSQKPSGGGSTPKGGKAS